MEAWRRGVKCLAVYRDGSKGSQPLSTRSQQDAESETDEAIADAPTERPIRSVSQTRDLLLRTNLALVVMKATSMLGFMKMVAPEKSSSV